MSGHRGSKFTQERSRFLRSLRENADRLAVGLPARHKGFGLTQNEAVEGINRLTAEGHHIGPRRLRSLESLSTFPWPQNVADAYARFLRLAEPELSAFYEAVGRMPAEARVLELTGVTDADLFYLYRTLAGTAAYLSDAVWDMLEPNPWFRALVPGLLPQMNIMEYVLKDPRGRKIFVNFLDWAVPMLNQLDTALSNAERVGDKALANDLARLLDSLLMDPDVAEVWRGERCIDISPNGDIRWIRPPDPSSPDGLGKPLRVQLYVTIPVMRLGQRFMTVTLLDEWPGLNGLAPGTGALESWRGRGELGRAQARVMA